MFEVWSAIISGLVLVALLVGLFAAHYHFMIGMYRDEPDSHDSEFVRKHGIPRGPISIDGDEVVQPMRNSSFAIAPKSKPHGAMVCPCCEHELIELCEGCSASALPSKVVITNIEPDGLIKGDSPTVDVTVCGSYGDVIKDKDGFTKER